MHTTEAHSHAAEHKRTTGSTSAPCHASVLGMRVDPIDEVGAVERIVGWARNRESRMVCSATVHMVMEAQRSATYLSAVNSADLLTPDGMPLVWILRMLGFRHVRRAAGPDLVPMLLAVAASERIPVGFFGGTPTVIARICQVVRRRYPQLNVPFVESPPFRPLTHVEDRTYVDQINSANVRILFVGLGCPKQEHWMIQHRGHVHAVMMGVGAAFDFLAGTKPRAPHWMRRAGLEWLFRLCVEPRRLWRRYALLGTQFFARLLLDQIGQRIRRTRAR